MTFSVLQFSHLAAALEEAGFEDPRQPLTFEGVCDAGMIAALKLLKQAHDNGEANHHAPLAHVAKRVEDIFPELEGLGLPGSLSQILLSVPHGSPSVQVDERADENNGLEGHDLDPAVGLG